MVETSSTDQDAPRQVSDRVTEVNISGYLLPWRDGQPVQLTVTGSDRNAAVVFSTEAKLRNLMKDYEIPYDDVKQVTDGREFIASLPGGLDLLVDPFKAANGRLRYTQLKIDWHVQF
jgi:hypothetical protein